MSSVRLSRVHFAYQPEHPVLRGIDLDVRDGEIVGLVGHNGAGKTTTFRLLTGLLRPDAGEIEVAGLSLLSDAREVRRRASYVPDEPMLYPTLSALENLNMFALLWGVPARVARERSERLLTEVGLWSSRHIWVRDYSRGMRQKLAFCAALLSAPRVLLMDEPFTGLDLDAAMWARAQLREFAANGGTVLFTSHIPELVEALAHTVAILHDGQIADCDTRDRVVERGGIVSLYERLVHRDYARAIA